MKTNERSEIRSKEPVNRKNEHRSKASPWKAFKVFVKGVPTTTIYAESYEKARLLCEGRLDKVAFKPIKYSKIVPL